MDTIAQSMPAELVRLVFDFAARDGLDDEPRFALGLQLVSTDVRHWLLPLLYQTFSVKTPPFFCREGMDDDDEGFIDPDTPSMTFLLRMMTDPDAPPRRHIRHICFHSRYIYHYRRLFAQALSVVRREGGVRWEVDSIAIDVPLVRFKSAFSVIAPRLVFEARPWSKALYSGITSFDLANRQWRSDTLAETTTSALETLRLRLPQIFFDKETATITQSLRDAVASDQISNETAIAHTAQRARLVVQIEPEDGDDGSGYLKRLAVILPLLLKLAASRGVDVTFELPSSLRTPNHGQARDVSLFLEAIESHLRAQSAEVTHCATVQYCDAASSMPRSIQDYLCMIRRGHSV